MTALESGIIHCSGRNYHQAKLHSSCDKDKTITSSKQEDVYNDDGYNIIYFQSFITVRQPLLVRTMNPIIILQD